MSPKYICFHIFWTDDPFVSTFSLVVHRHKSECIVKDWIAMFKVKVTVMVQNFKA